MRLLGIQTPLFREKNNLFNFIRRQLPQLEEGDIVVIASKIVALAQGRVGRLKDKKKLIAKEAKKIIETPWASLTLTDDGWCINAGIDESNAERGLVLLPKNPFHLATAMHKRLTKQFSLQRLGVLITDTKSMPLRVGTIGRGLAYAGFAPIKSYIGQEDLFGRKSRLTESNVVDALAAGAVLLMGEGKERIPLVVIKDAPVQFTGKSFSRKKYISLALPPEKDIHAPIFKLSL